MRALLLCALLAGCGGGGDTYMPVKCDAALSKTGQPNCARVMT